MNSDLKSMSRKELEKLLKDVQKALQSVAARDKREAKKAAEKAAAEFGFSLDDLNEAEKKPRKVLKSRKTSPKKKSKPQFANPQDPSQTWTGKGRQPNWYRAAIDGGKSPDSMRV